MQPENPVEVEAAQQEKKRPGRPKKKIDNAPVEVQGLVDRPANEGDLMELVYYNPAMFKKLMQLYKQFEVSEVELKFSKQGIDINTTDHLKKSNIYTRIDGRAMHLYYCAEDIRICVKRDNLERVLNTLGKNHVKITFVLKDNYRSTLYAVVKDMEYNRDDDYEIDVVFKPEEPPLPVAHDDTDYPIKFRLSSRHFKTTINNTKKLSNTITLQKSGTDPVQLTYKKTQKVNWTGVYNDADKIDLKSTIEADDNFNISINIDYIQPFSNSNIGDSVVIAADKFKKISFTTFLDKSDKTDMGYACSIKIFTEIAGAV